MNPEQILLAVVVAGTVITTTSTLLLAGYAWSRRPAPGAVPFLFFMLTVGAWSLAQALELTTANWNWKLTFLAVQFAGIAFGPVLFLHFSLSYTGRYAHQRPVRRMLAILALIAAGAWLLAITNSRHLLIWRYVQFNPAFPLLPLQTRYGPGFWLYMILGSAEVLTGGFLFVRAFSSQRFYRAQVALLSLSGLVIVIGVFLHFFGPPRLSMIQPITVAFAVASLIGSYTIVRYRAFDMVPVARGRLVDRMVDGVIILDARDHIIDMNEAAETILATPAREAVGRTVGQALAHHQGLLDVYYARDKRQLEVPINQGGELNSYEINVADLHEGAEQRSGRLLVLHDISERKKLERIRHDLTYTMVHDLRNPITSNLTMLQLLDTHLDQIPSQDRQQLITAALDSMQRTLKLVDQIMEVNSLESGVVPMEPTVLHLAPLASDLLQTQFSLAADKKLQLENAVDLDLPPAWADPELIARVLQNLVGNAVKFTPAGGAIRIGARAGANDQVYVFVSDTGPGIAEEVRERLFEKFAVGPNRGRGTGLGLAFCKMVVEAHGGQIWVEATSAAGTTFVFTLPAAQKAHFAGVDGFGPGEEE